MAYCVSEVVFYLKSTPALLEIDMEIDKTAILVLFFFFFFFFLSRTYSSTGRSVGNNSHTIPRRSPVHSAFSQNPRKYRSNNNKYNCLEKHMARDRNVAIANFDLALYSL